MPQENFIQVILPIKLEWEPLYSSDLQELEVGDRVRVNFAGKEYVAVISKVDALEEAEKVDVSKVKPIERLEEDLERILPTEIELWRQIASYYLCTIGEVYKAAYPFQKVLHEGISARAEAAREAREQKEREKAVAKVEKLRQRIARKDELISRARGEETRQRYTQEKEKIQKELQDLLDTMEGLQDEPLLDLHFEERGEIKLSPAQTKAYNEIKDIFKAGKPALLFGVTGSGKTELYLKLAKETLAKGRNVLYLVPGIALSRQLEDRVRAVFHDDLQVFHSGETASTRIKVISSIRDGQYIVLGTRSSLLLSHRNLGLIIVDEEHDTSYKQESPAPRYNGREVAIMMAKMFGADIILGSATPSLESIYNGSAGRYGTVRLTQRYYNSLDSDVEVIDTIAERKKRGMVGSFSRKLIDHINTCLTRHEQIVILRERRAYSQSVQCESCGKIEKCKSCNVTLSVHKGRYGHLKLVCHYCGKVYPYTGLCSSCGGTLKPIGAGTQKVEEEAKALFPNARIARLDSDSTHNRNKEAQTIRDFAKGRLDILIGTQIITKGFDFSGLKLVAVLQADSILGLQDFRSDERGFQMLQQFRGRCGRRGEKGLFVIQTSQPEHPIYQCINGLMTGQDLGEHLLAERKMFGYPPYSRVVGVIIKDYNLSRIETMSKALAETLGATCGAMGTSASIVGPYSPQVDKVSNQYIRKIRILLRKDKSLGANKKAILGAVDAFEKERKYIGHIALDVDPA